MDDIVVLKFGGSVLRTAGDLPLAVHEIYRWYREGHRVLAVVSALGDTTNKLLEKAKALSEEPEPHALAALLATGERVSAALLGLALDKAGVPVQVIDPNEIALSVMGSALDSEPVSIDSRRTAALFASAPVLIVPGFFGHTAQRRLQLLGRGGSDLTAVFLATALRAPRCRLLKDVDGVYDHDPASGPAGAHRFSALSYAQALEVADQLIQPKAVRFLERHHTTAEVAAPGRGYESIVGPYPGTVEEATHRPPSRVLLLGHGRVGAAVYERLSALPDHFTFSGVLVRDRSRICVAELPDSLVHTDEATVAGMPVDIVVDVLSDPETSSRLITHFIERGIDVVSASKMVIADRGPSLSARAAVHGGTLRYSAAVGGSAPMVEAVRRLSHSHEITRITGVLNGTCNYIIDRFEQGLSLLAALREAQARSLTEPHWIEDLSGRDAERKLRILAHHAFGQALDSVQIEAFDEIRLSEMQATVAHNHPAQDSHGAARHPSVRLVATAWREDRRVLGRVGLAVVEASDPLAGVRAEWNALTIHCRPDYQMTVRGRGAGPGPTAEAIVADLMELRR